MSDWEDQHDMPHTNLTEQMFKDRVGLISSAALRRGLNGHSLPPQNI
jgi:hypothetical protein